MKAQYYKAMIYFGLILNFHNSILLLFNAVSWSDFYIIPKDSKLFNV